MPEERPKMLDFETGIHPLLRSFLSEKLTFMSPEAIEILDKQGNKLE